MTNYRIVIAFLLGIFSVNNSADILIKNADLNLQGDWYVLNANIDYQLTATAKAAIENSIPLFWRLQIQLAQLRLLNNRLIVDSEYRYRIRYHALLNSYSVKNETLGQIKKYASLTEALESLSHIRELKIIPKQQIRANKYYRCQIRLVFEVQALPPPLTPLAYLQSEWRLSSDWFLIFDRQLANPNLSSIF
ncbi:MAG: hypothetical protein RL637_176 [Pseudomonadota bacterium]